MSTLRPQARLPPLCAEAQDPLHSRVEHSADDEALPVPTGIGCGSGVLGNQSSLMNKRMNQTESLPYEIMSSLVCPHSRGKSSFFLLPFIFSWFPISRLLLDFLYFSLGLLSLAPSFPTWEISLLGGLGNRILVSCFSLVSKPYSACKQEDRCARFSKRFGPPTLVPELACEEMGSREQASVYQKSRQECPRPVAG